MNSNRVLLAIGPALLRESLAQTLELETDAEIVGQIAECDPVSLLMAVRKSEADVLIHAESSNEMFASSYTHLFAQFPGLVVVRIDPERNSACTFRQMIHTTVLPSCDLHDVVTTIRPHVAAA